MEKNSLRLMCFIEMELLQTVLLMLLLRYLFYRCKIKKKRFQMCTSEHGSCLSYNPCFPKRPPRRKFPLLFSAVAFPTSSFSSTTRLYGCALTLLPACSLESIAIK